MINSFFVVQGGEVDSKADSPEVQKVPAAAGIVEDAWKLKRDERAPCCSAQAEGVRVCHESRADKS